jgi:GT2 family glycosyltransferase/tetratricopeptide (TPR) repeat protein
MASNLTPKNQTLFDILAQHLNEGSPAEVLEALIKAPKKIHSLPDFLGLRGAALFDLGQLAEAIKVLQEVLKQTEDPQPWWLIRLAMAYNAQKRWADSLLIYRRLQSDFPDDYPMWVNHGLGEALLYTAKGPRDEKVQQAIQCFQNAIRLNADFPWSRIGLGLAYKFHGEMDKAILLFRSALDLVPADAALELATLYREQGRIEAARNALREVIDSGLREARLFDSLAQTEIAASNWVAAAEAWKRAAELVEDGAGRDIFEEKRLRAELELACMNKDWDSGARALESWLAMPTAQRNMEDLLAGEVGFEVRKAEFDPASWDAKYSKTGFDPANWIAEYSVEVLLVLRRLHDRQPENPTVLRLRGEAAHRLGRWKEAQEAFSALLVPDIWAWVNQPSPSTLDRALKTATLCNPHALPELPPELVSRCLAANSLLEEPEKTKPLLRLVITRSSASALKGAGAAVGVWLLQLLPEAFEQAEALQNWDNVLDWLEVLDALPISDPLPDWLAIEIIWLFVQLRKTPVTACAIDAVPSESGQTAAKVLAEKLAQLRLWKAVSRFDQEFPLLDSSWMQRQTFGLKVRVDSVRSLSDFLSLTDGSVLSPHILFDVKWYCLRENLQFSQIHPLIHFFRRSRGDSEESPRPNAFFDCDWYRTKYLSGDGEQHPLLHYVAHFTDSTIQPSELFANQYVRETQGLLPDEDPLVFYLEQIANLGVSFRLKGFSPYPLFDREHYLCQNQDIKAIVEGEGLDPFEHFVLHGRDENRNAHPWQQYNQFVNHEFLHLEPFNLDCPYNNAMYHPVKGFHYLKGRKARESYFEGQKSLAKRLPYRPCISVIVPVFQVKPRFLIEMMESVLAQTYDNWQLCIVDDASRSYKEEIHSILSRYSKQDDRIRFGIREENGHICRTSNDCLALADGEFVALLDHDDLLTPDALYEYAAVLNDKPDLDILYSDEDKVDAWGVLSSPYYKPDWSPHSLWSRMYVCHLTVYRRELVSEVGGFRVGFEGSQDHDLLLRCSALTKRIHHIPRVLYHWRMHSDSTASTPNAKPYAGEACRKAVQEAMAARGIEAQVSMPINNSSKVWVRPKAKGNPRVEVIIPSRNQARMLSQCLISIFEKTTYANMRVTVVDNGSTDKEFHRLMEEWENSEPDRFRVIIDDRPFNYAALNNGAARICEGDYLLFLNNDTQIISETWIEDMLGYAQLEEIGAVGAKLYYQDGSIQHAGAVTGVGGIANHVMCGSPGDAPGYAGNLELVTNYSVVTGACMMVSKTKFQNVGGFEEYLAVAFNDVDLCLKLRKLGLYNVYLPFVELYHYESKSRGMDNSPEKAERLEKETFYMRQAWGEVIDSDPFYSPWLTRDGINMSNRFHSP